MESDISIAVRPQVDLIVPGLEKEARMKHTGEPCVSLDKQEKNRRSEKTYRVH